MVSNLERRILCVLVSAFLSFLITFIYKSGKDPFFIFLFFTFSFLIFWAGCETLLIFLLTDQFFKKKFETLEYSGELIKEELEFEENFLQEEIKDVEEKEVISFPEDRTKKKIEEIIKNQPLERISSVIKTWLLEEK